MSLFLGRDAHQSHYWMMPVPNANLASGFSLTRAFHQRALVAVSLGLFFSILISFLAMLVCRKRAFPLLRRWYVQLALMVMGMAAVLISISYVNLLLPFLAPF